MRGESSIPVRFLFFGFQFDSVEIAWTVAFDPQFDKLLMAAKEATEIGVRTAGIDVQMCEVLDIESSL